MAHYAFLDENSIVTEVIVGRNEYDLVDGITSWEEWYGTFKGQKCIRTSYNHNIRKQYAGIGYRYDEVADVFVAPSPYPSWILDENFDWQPPTPMPEIEENQRTWWDEEIQDWRVE